MRAIKALCVELANFMFFGHSRTRLSFGRKSRSGLLTLSASALPLVVLWVALAPAITAQVPGADKAKTSAPAPQAQPPSDPFGRGTPRGTIIGFIRAADRDDHVSAARYLQFKPKQRSDPEALARQLSELLDRYFSQPVTTISDSPEGALDDGLPIDQERIGRFKVGKEGEEEFEVGLVRVKDKDAGEIWLISSETLAKVPSLHRSLEASWLERVMPQALLSHSIFGISWAQVVAWAGSIGVPLLVLLLVSFISIFLARKIIHRVSRRRFLESWYDGLRWPLIIVLTLGVHLASLQLFDASLNFRITYGRIVVVLLIAALTWFIHRLLKLSFEEARIRAIGRERTSTGSLMLLGQRLLSVLVVVIAMILILTLYGIDTKTALAGLGIGGVAVAFGAQKTVENFLGGIFLLSDRVIAVGDLCCIANRMGVIEDITLRSVRLRTSEQTLLSIPAGVLSQDSIENFSTRGKIMLKSILRLRYGASSEQLRAVLDGIQKLLKENPDLETQSSRVRLADFGVRAIEIELFAYVLTSDGLKFLSVREQLLLQVAGIVEASGSSFATPEILEVLPESAATQEKQRVH